MKYSCKLEGQGSDPQHQCTCWAGWGGGGVEGGGWIWEELGEEWGKEYALNTLYASMKFPESQYNAFLQRKAYSWTFAK